MPILGICNGVYDGFLKKYFVLETKEKTMEEKAMRKGNFAVAQSGGPTAAINATLLGVIEGAMETGCTVFGAVNGIKGVIDNNFMNLNEIFENDENRALLKNTPGAYLGSCRIKLPDSETDDAMYKRIFEVFEENDITRFVYIGGNDSMDTVDKLSKYAEEHNIDVAVVGAPKTIDNDLAGTDHTPGFGSAARFVASSVKEVARDSGVYAEKSITIIEIMGRNAGWLTSSAALARGENSTAPHLIYLPERPVSRAKIIEDIKNCPENNIIIAVSEGIKDENGEYYCAQSTKSHDIFGHAQLAGCAKLLEEFLGDEFGYKMRSVELSVLQRCGGHFTSLTDLNESEAIGKASAKAAAEGRKGVVTAFERVGDYECRIIENKVSEVANKEKTVPDEFIAEGGNDVTEAFIKYCKPLIMGDVNVITEDGVPKHITR